MSCFQCPLCHLPLDRHDKHYRCAGQHCFDCAKEGYVNLLPVQFKRSKDPGDAPLMMAARRVFLDAGHYQPLRDSVMASIAALTPHAGLRWLDIGCGEGYYTAALADLLTRQRPEAEVYGMDIAKNAVRSAAKRYAQVRFCVASSQRLPFADASLDGVMRIYAPSNPAELRRALRPGGMLLTVTPGPRHLYQLKALIYRDVQLHAPKEETLAGFAPLGESALCYPLRLTGAEGVALLRMTPFAWRATTEVLERLAVATSFDLETDFIVRLWRRV
ncbi:23S rRNA (guanine(745)-N(1))-methyltransferase [Sodalis praecaptivus]|uniref:23S rRNA (guanine(745)-N(1))-methyltransferase n=1 Tax=Sodalis praecaptivus TaxID=1239307 RepID=UPI0027F4AF4B|nr:23S rRNA (guanine(745)-N(1))-methyltransferase [Sodalis praecaptivus]CAJ0999009.1 23S rRNA (guanine(745)-N(1))-methyltransferase [Sodalis praecaptivus]